MSELAQTNGEAPAKSFFATSPLERHGDTEDGRKAAVVEADRMLREYFQVLEHGELGLYALDVKIDLCERAIHNLTEKRAALVEERKGLWDTVVARANARLGQVRLYFEEYVRHALKEPPATQKELPAGEVVFKKQSGTTEWVAEGEDLLKIVQDAMAQLPFQASQAMIGEHKEAVLRTTTRVMLSNLADHLSQDENGTPVLYWVNAETGQRHEVPCGLTIEHPDGEVTLDPLQRKVDPLQEYIVTARRRKEQPSE